MRIILDVDGTLTINDTALDYADRQPRPDVITQVNTLHAAGAYVVVYSSRNMRTFDGNVGRINAVTLPTMLEWLDRHEVAYDEVHVGKPWCGHEGFYVSGRGVRPRAFAAGPIAGRADAAPGDKESAQ